MWNYIEHWDHYLDKFRQRGGIKHCVVLENGKLKEILGNLFCLPSNDLCYSHDTSLLFGISQVWASDVLYWLRIPPILKSPCRDYHKKEKEKQFCSWLPTPSALSCPSHNQSLVFLLCKNSTLPNKISQMETIYFFNNSKRKKKVFLWDPSYSWWF